MRMQIKYWLQLSKLTGGVLYLYPFILYTFLFLLLRTSNLCILLIQKRIHNIDVFLTRPYTFNFHLMNIITLTYFWGVVNNYGRGSG